MDPLVLDPTEAGYDTPELEGFSFAPFVNPTRGPSIAPNRPVSFPAPTGGSQSNQWQQLGPLLAILPAILKGQGTVGVAAFLQGMQQARQQKQQQAAQQGQQAFQNQRMTDADARAQEAQDALANYRDETLGNQQKAASARFLQDIAAKLSVAETPEQIESIKQMAALAGPFVGVEPHAIAAVAAKAAPTSSSLIERQVKKVLTTLKPEDIDQYLQSGAALKVPGQAMPIPFAQWSQYLTRGIDPKTGQPMLTAKKPETSKPSLEQQYLDAIQAGNTTLAQEIKQSANIRDNPKPASQSASGLPAATLRRVDQKTRAFDSLPIVKTVQKQAEAASFAESLDPNTKNPADDQALIYAFAKAMDPDSVVREGEYATVQKYAQSWAESFGFSAARIFSNTPFLTPQSRQNMKKTIRAKYQAGRAQYDNVRKSYATQINRITGTGDGEGYLTDYGGAFPAGPSGGGGAGASSRYQRYLESKGAK